jgi:hypothetical protein
MKNGWNMGCHLLGQFSEAAFHIESNLIRFRQKIDGKWKSLSLGNF